MINEQTGGAGHPAPLCFKEKDMDNIEIRQAVPDDAEALIEYLNMIGGESDNLTFGKDEFPITAEQERTFL